MLLNYCISTTTTNHLSLWLWAVLDFYGFIDLYIKHQVLKRFLGDLKKDSVGLPLSVFIGSGQLVRELIETGRVHKTAFHFR
jgi:hypothetical protein